MRDLEQFIADLQEKLSTNGNFCREVCKLCNNQAYPCKERLLAALHENISTIAGLKQSYRKVKLELEQLKRSKNTPKPVDTAITTHVKIKGYFKLQKFTLEEILPLIGGHSRLVITPKISVGVHSTRLRTFKRSTVCAHCGIKATHFWAESNNDCTGYHLNMYATHPGGYEILMTKDHIIPKSRGGSENIGNMQTMCTKCNSKKGNQLEEELCQR